MCEQLGHHTTGFIKFSITDSPL